MKISKLGTIFAVLWVSTFGCAQSTFLEEVDSLIQIKDYSNARLVLNAVDTLENTPFQFGKYYQLRGRLEVLENNSTEGYKYYLKARNAFQSIDSLELKSEVNLQIIQLINATNMRQLDYTEFMDDYLEYAKQKNSPELLSKAYMQLGKCFINTEPQSTIHFFKLAEQENSKTNDTLMNAKIHHNIGVLFAEYTSELDSALYHYDIAFTEYKKRGLIDYMSYIFNNKATVYKKQGDYTGAIRNYHLADSLPIKEYVKKTKGLLYGHLADAYEKNDDASNALKYFKLQKVYNDSLAEDAQNAAILDIQTKYEVEKKENENLRLKQNRNWLLGGLIAAVLLTVLSYLAYSNQRKRKLLIQKEHQVQAERLDAVLKEQELLSLDAMVAGQEKERQRIANDLHDNLGSLLATLKLHFQNLKVKKDRIKDEENELLQKTDTLIEEAYQKVRSIAHAKNVGLKAKEGLLPAIKNFASKVSVVNRLVIEVEDHGMEERLENSLEITLFRIIQELISNVIKHARATESTIHITHHDKNINIMVEDNGVGFDPAMISNKDGMGLYSIQKRVENLDGTLTIDSVPGKGTSVIIDIPLP